MTRLTPQFQILGILAEKWCPTPFPKVSKSSLTLGSYL